MMNYKAFLCLSFFMCIHFIFCISQHKVTDLVSFGTKDLQKGQLGKELNCRRAIKRGTCVWGCWSLAAKNVGNL